MYVNIRARIEHAYVQRACWFKSLGHQVPSASVQDDVAPRSAPDQWMEEPEEPLAEQDRVKDFQALLGLTVVAPVASVVR